MSTTAKPLQLDQLDAHMKTVWRRAQLLHLVAGALAMLRWLVPLFLLGVAADWLWNIPPVGRAGILVALLGISLYKSWKCGWCKLRKFDATQTALEIEHHHGGLASLLVSAVQFRDATAERGTSTSFALRDKTCRVAEETASTLAPEKTVPLGVLYRPTCMALALGGLLCIFAGLGGPFLLVGLTRIFAPWLVIAYPTYTQVDLVEGNLVVQQGGSAVIKANVSGRIPASANLILRTGDGPPRDMQLDITGGMCEYTIASASRDFTYQIEAGDARTDSYRVQVVPAPRYDHVNVELNFPAYLERAPETLEALTLTVPEGTEVHWDLTLDRPIRKAWFLRDAEEPIELPVSQEGHQVTFRALASDSRGYRFSWVEKEHGFEFTSPRYYLQVAADQAPQVELTSPEANLFAMPGRPLELAVRARDDHALAGAKVAYRVNRRPEQSVDLAATIQDAAGAQVIPWDYRTVIPELGVGDTVSFAVEVSDRYPGPDGPHRARSETRRLTFLSQEEYLKQIRRKRDRLLSRVRTIYRQERAAHEIVLKLDPGSDSFAQTCQLEAIRQEMLRNQLKEIASKLQALLDDLAANNVSDAPQGNTLDRIRLALVSLADSDIARAASLLRDQSSVVADGATSTDPEQAAIAVNSAARELGSLVLLRDIDSAQEVYARETHMLARMQASLRWQTLVSSPDSLAKKLSQQQAELSEWTERLILDLQNGMRYDKRPLAVLRLSRSVKDLRNAQVAPRMREAAQGIQQGDKQQVGRVQAELVKRLLDAEFSVRLSGAYATVIKTRDALNFMTQTQRQLKVLISELPNEAMDSERTDVARQQQELRRDLLSLLLPSIPAPRAQLFDETHPQAPPVDPLLAEADLAMSAALSQLTENRREQAVLEQAKAEQALDALTQIVARWSVDMGLQSQGLGTLVAASSERMARLEDYEANVIGLLEKTDSAAAEEKDVAVLAEPCQALADDVAQFRQDLEKQHQSTPDQDLPPLLSRLQQSETALNATVVALTKNDVDQAIEFQEQSADAFAEAYAIVVAQNERLGMLQDLLMFQRAVGFANHYMTDIVAEQRDLLAASEAAEGDAVLKLLPVFDNMRRCLDDVAPLLDLVAGRLDVGTPLAFAKTDLEDAIAALKIGDKFDAVDAQDVAAESLAEVQAMIQAVQTQTGYVAEIVEFLHTSTSDTATLQFTQEQLWEKLAAITPEQVKSMVPAQRTLATQAAMNAENLEAATGMSEFTEAADEIQETLARIEAGEAESATEQAELAAAILAENSESLLGVISMLHGLPSIEVTSQTKPELVRLIEVLAVASDHKQVLRDTGAADSEEIAALIERQQTLATRCEELIQTGEPHPLLSEASKHLAEATSLFSSEKRDAVAIRRVQKAADDQLRHFIVEQALVLDTAVKAAPSEGDPGDSGEGSDSESALAAGFISDFVSGETPKDQRTEWKVLGDRNRAALNQNFARELPLEYRGLLKNYYERLSK